jgi:two-component system, chemotaxis family, protein-glutamate methylesterase/glutaminase
MAKIRVLVVDDSVVARRVISGIISTHPGCEVVGAAANGSIALQKIPQVNPDLITMDLEMPGMDGVQTVAEIRKTYKDIPIIMVSSLTEAGAAVTLRALSAGASDYVTKASNPLQGEDATRALSDQLLPKIDLLCKKALAGCTSTSVKPAAPAAKGAPVMAPRMSMKKARIELVAIGVSTGGPNALAEVFSNVLQPVNVPIVIVQHMPPMFTKTLAVRLDALNGPVRFHEGEEGMEIQNGHAYIAPGGKHMDIRREGLRMVIRLHEGPPENSCRPAVDVTFRSVVSLYGASILAVILTGMGQDGLRGCELIAEAGGRVLAQDEASSVVWGMPGFVARAGLANEVLPLSQIGGRIVQIVAVSHLAHGS